MEIGIVGLPNAGKSTIFNALIQANKAEVANYPFCTIEPNIGIVNVPDERVYKIAELEKSKKATPATIKFIDIAGLVRGASKGEGLGNQFLSYIRQVSAIAHVIRCFEDQNISHVEGSIDPVRDAEIVEVELIMADLKTLEKRLEKTKKLVKTDTKSAKAELETLLKAKALLEELKPLRQNLNLFKESEINFLEKELFLLTIKPMMYIANISEKDLPEGEKNPSVINLKDFASKNEISIIVLCGKIEQELIELPEEERKEFMEVLNLKESGLNKMIKTGYKLLDLITFFTTNPKETKAWTIKRGTKALKAAGKIHSDIEKGFVAAEVINYKDYIQIGSLHKAKELGLIKIEGKDYEIKDGDIIYFRFNI
ncbi:MAG: redox-regulated ATPase YchF [Thermodesulfobacterium geofontis]|uniref:Ribosome-binding ATPase YchF n=2 Tax=Thermodesulfobacterium geofontis TaxID=1295609 RepID=A0A2N7PPA7_9BACT|nr:MAG: redox-regulated ATPase YchF [Thermodesulfobacterium geofontis]